MDQHVVVVAQHLAPRDHSPLSARNSSAPEVLNASAHCLAEAVPSIHEYYTAINVAGITLFTLGAAAVLFILFVYVDTLRHVMQKAPPLVKTHSAFVLGVYPVVAIATYCAIIVPRAQLLAEAVTQGMFMAALYQLFCLLVAYCGGEAELVRRAKPDSLDTRVAPCCCWPCCCCLPQLQVSKTNVRKLRLLVLQLPVVQGLVYMVLMVMWAEEESLYQVNYMYFQPAIAISIFFGIWGMSMTIKVLQDVLCGHRMRSKFMVLQLVLLCAKLQGLASRAVAWGGVLPCRPPITPAVYANLVYNSLMLSEMVVLSIVARHLYHQELPELDSGSHPAPQQVCVIGDLLPGAPGKLSRVLDAQPLGRDNKAFSET
ncbi:organic solute transporter alpha-like protein [Bacillus rossius redtenbacheri]|uniref:organic solute transporter alpha-like protein n=1 Tax=Bacillus rossius redtenbacheri TaxID=93214 RepID=UPI002FDC7EF4